MEEIREAALAYYANMSDEEKKIAEDFFHSMDANKDGRISFREYAEFLKREFVEISRSDFFEKLDEDGKGSLSFEEVLTLFYICYSGRFVYCAECRVFLKGLYFTCFNCFCSADDKCYNLCPDCYRSKRYDHHNDAVYCDNFVLLQKSRSIVADAPQEKKNTLMTTIKVITAIKLMVKCATIATSVASGTVCSIQ